MRRKKTTFLDLIFIKQILFILLYLPLYILKNIGDFFLFVPKKMFYLCLRTYNKIKKTKYSYTASKPLLRQTSKTVSKKQETIFGKTISAFQIRKKLREYNSQLLIRLKTKLRYYDIARYLKSGIYAFSLRLKFYLLGALSVIIIVSVMNIGNYLENLPNPSFIPQNDIPATTKIFDRNGNLLYDIYKDEDRIPISLSQLPKHVIDATIASEDDEFYTHEGISLKGIIRALIHNFNSDNLEGGSTITQQLIRSVYLKPEKTYSRKIKEIILAVWTEKIYSKNEIIEMYLNQVPYGGTSYGVEAAAKIYFGKSAKELELHEAAYLSGLPKAPTTYSPYNSDGKSAKKRQEEILYKMLKKGYINQKQYKTAFESPLTIRSQRHPISAPHFVMYVKNLLENTYGKRIVETGGLRVTTTLDLNMNNAVENIINSELDKIRDFRVTNAAALITNPENGEILSMVGSRNYFDTEHDGNTNVTLSLRQPGSSIKVVTYASALENGFTAGSIISDTPVSYRINNQIYKPANYDGRYHGAVSLRTALGSSYNIPAVRTLEKIGINKMIEKGEKMGISTWNRNDLGLSLTLGGGEVRMLDLVKVYGSLANKGVLKDLKVILKISDYKGKNLPLPPQKKDIKAVSEEIAFIISDILSDNTARTPAFGPNSQLSIPGKTVAVKTGTSDLKRDNWTIGYTPTFLAAVWVGNNDNSPMDQRIASGITGATPIWNQIVNYYIHDKNDTPFYKPWGIKTCLVNGRYEYYIKGTQPKKCR
jgi:1A family penicillin-binding protein